MSAECGAVNVALTALATGFGNLSLQEFADGVTPLLTEEFPPIKNLFVAQIEDYRYRAILVNSV